MKVAVITGASSGIGLSLGEELSKEGYLVYCLSRSKAETDALVHVPCDVTQEDSVRQAVAEVVEKSQRIDVLVTCAGYGIAGPIEFMKEKDMIRQTDVNLYGVIRTIQACLPYMRNQSLDEKGLRGKIVIVGSMASVLPLPFQGMYSMTKAALLSLTGVLRNETRAYKIEFTCLLPGDVHTNFTSKRKTDWDGKEAYPAMDDVLKEIEKDETTGLEPQVISHRIAKIIKKKHFCPSYTLDGLSKIEAWLPRVVTQKFVLSVIRKHYHC